jgi:hypothetical protein
MSKNTPLNITINGAEYMTGVDSPDYDNDKKNNSNIKHETPIDEYSNYIINTNQKLQVENCDLRVTIKELEEKIKLLEKTHLKEKEIIQLEYEKTNESLEEDIDKEEKKRLCLIGWLHNLNDMKKKTKIANDKYKIIYKNIIDFYKNLYSNISDIYSNIIYLLTFITGFPILAYIFNIIGFGSLIKIMFMEIIYLGIIGFNIKIILNKNNFLTDIINFDTNMIKYNDKFIEINKIIKDVNKTEEKCTEIDDIIDNI